MKNIEVIKKFIARKVAKSSNNNLRTNGDRIVNYSTGLAEWTQDGKKVIVNTTKYSVTTSKIQTYIRYELRVAGIDTIEVTGVPCGRYELTRYLK